VVDRESQKPIVVGKGGEMVKRIGMAAREELERFFSTHVFLDLHVRVSTDWREDERALKNCSIMPGFDIPKDLVVSVSKRLDDGSAPPGLVAWANSGRALAAYRQGAWDDARRWADSVLDGSAAATLPARSLACAVSALANHRQGNNAAAKDKLAQAQQERDRQPFPKLADGSIDERLMILELPASWWDWINVELLRREAATLLAGEAKSPPTSSAATTSK
jgi:hypothetical protein